MANNILTQWGEQLESDNVLKEYPRPQFVRDSYQNLNGVWQYAITDSPRETDAYQGDIIVPFSPETPLSGVGRTLLPEQYLHYKKVFILDEHFNRGRVILHFGAVDQIARVELNGKICGEHKGGYLPFSFDVTDKIKRGENVLILKVRDLSDTSFYSRGKQKIQRGGIWYSPQSGIWQTVWLESTPKKALNNVKITPDYDDGSVSFDMEFFGGKQNCKIEIYDGDSLVSAGAGSESVTLKLDSFKSWSPESPFLYDVKYITDDETVTSYFGMRKFSVGKDKNGVHRLFLNNAPYFHNGVLDQGYYPDGFLTPPSDEAMQFDIDAMKDMGFNMLRKHIKIEPLRWYYYCDKVGMLVWQDMVNGGEKYGLEVSAIPFINIVMDDKKYKNFGRSNQKGREMYCSELEQTVNLLYNCPCIAMWVPFNEGWGQFDSRRAYDKLKSMDKTRLVDHASGWHDQGAGDFISKHIYFTPIKVKQYDKPYILSEFGGLGLKIQGHTFNEKTFGYKMYKSQQLLQSAYTNLFEKSIIPQIKTGLSATVYTQLTDVEDEINGFYTYDRKVCKYDLSEMRRVNGKVTL